MNETNPPDFVGLSAYTDKARKLILKSLAAAVHFFKRHIVTRPSRALFLIKI
ncbi:hypothetical protein Plhal304r1_c007g0029371 [Plasmopara halstedii]